MFAGDALVGALRSAGITQVVWIPDSVLGRWDQALSQAPDLELIRVCREGEAIALAGGLLLGGQHPIVLLQCTGLFEAGDALRNVVHDLQLPLFLLVGVRSYHARQAGTSTDSCPVFTEPILRAWQIPYRVLSGEHGLDELVQAYQESRATQRAGAVLLPE
jgi:sulfopyruvate decarboxylase TPP-binding subunit